MTAVPIVLASTSAIRAQLLASALVPFTTRSPGVDEEAIKAAMLAEGAPPRDVADVLAETKAVRVSQKMDGLVIGADSTVELDGALIDKAASIEEARSRLKSFRGRSHALHSAVVVARDGQPIWREVKTARMHVRAFSDEWLEGYLAREGDAVLWSVGCYRLEGEGVQLFDRIDGDYFGILGLPLTGLLDLLRRHGALET
ncbi:MAG: septum formation protein Maf [Caulobacterales bacterium 32-69-10]|nr:MAG: septum formation protein Maf [Caulobacterales bacterium 32-69-10]